MFRCPWLDVLASMIFVGSEGCLDVPGLIFCGSVIFLLDRLSIYLGRRLAGRQEVEKRSVLAGLKPQTEAGR